jgi:hypothetical protein
MLSHKDLGHSKIHNLLDPGVEKSVIIRKKDTIS